MRIWDNIKDAFFTDKALFPSTTWRIIWYVVSLSGAAAFAIGIIPVLEVLRPKYSILIVVGFVVFVYTIAIWMGRATRYICDKERDKEA